MDRQCEWCRIERAAQLVVIDSPAKERKVHVCRGCARKIENAMTQPRVPLQAERVS